MSTQQLEYLPKARLKQMANQYRQARTIQKNAADSIRLSIVSGHLSVDLTNLGSSDSTVSDFVDITSDDDDVIVVGSLVHSAFLVTSGSPVTIQNWDSATTGIEGLSYRVWLPYALETPLASENELYDVATIQAYQVPDNKIRIGLRAEMASGSIPASPTLTLYALYQIRMTTGWR